MNGAKNMPGRQAKACEDGGDGAVWLAFAAGSALFSGLTAVLAKCGIRRTDSTVATAIRTIVVLAFSWLMVLVAGSGGQMASLDPTTRLFLVLSGAATGASWLCYFRALQLGSVSRVTPIDKSSTVMTIVLAAVLLGEPFGPVQLVATALVGAGTLAMVRPGGAGREPDIGKDAPRPPGGLAGSCMPCSQPSLPR